MVQPFSWPMWYPRINFHSAKPGVQHDRDQKRILEYVCINVHPYIYEMIIFEICPICFFFTCIDRPGRISIVFKRGEVPYPKIPIPGLFNPVPLSSVFLPLSFTPLRVMSSPNEKDIDHNTDHDHDVWTSSKIEQAQDAEFGGPEARRKLERRLLLKLDLRMSIMVVIYILNYVCLFLEQCFWNGVLDWVDAGWSQ